MTIEIKAPTFPESIADGTVAAWHKQPGEHAARDEVLAEIETDKVVLEIVAPTDGTLKEVLRAEGDTVLSEEVIAIFVEGAGVASSPARGSDDAAAPVVEEQGKSGKSKPAGAGPAARKLAVEKAVDLAGVDGTGRDGRVTKADVVKASTDRPAKTAVTRTQTPVVETTGERSERRVPMTRLRASIAKRLVAAQRTAAMLTTFNEVDMSSVIALRKRYKEEFERRHNGTKLGFMSFFVRASVEALKRFPAVNASIDENDIIYHGYYDIGVAVSSERGLVVPVIRDADSLSLAQIEDHIRDYGTKARDGKLTIDEMSGGTFTISNGGVFGSLLSTPILNPPQTGILGMHKIQERPIAVDGEVVVRPMMYLALSYDHRLIDGQEAVRFLITIKELLEEPARIMLDL